MTSYDLPPPPALLKRRSFYYDLFPTEVENIYLFTYLLIFI